MQNDATARRTEASELSFVEVSDGTRIAYRRSGAAGKPKVLLIHSLALDGTVWDGVTEILQNDAEIIRVDCRGHGASDKPAGPYSVERFADDLGELLQQVGWDEAVIGGCSMGGCVAQAFAARHASRTRALLLVDTTAWYGPNAPQDWHGRAGKARSDGLASMAQFQTTRWFGDAFRETHPDAVRRYMDVFIENDIDAYASTCAMMGDLDLRASSKGIEVPTGVVVGEEDYAAPPRMAEELAGLIEGATLTILPKARHLTPIECPGPIAAQIMELTVRTFK